MIQIILQKRVCFMVLLLLPLFAHAQDQGTAFSFGNLSFSLTPRILQDGSITDFSLGMMYSGSLGAELQFRSTKIAKNEELSSTDDSLNAVNETIYEVGVLPVQYRMIKDNLRLMVGAGLYYKYDKLNERGFFTLNILEQIGKERVNSYNNDFTMHLAGPLLDGRFIYNSEWFNFGFTAGIVPIFNANLAQKVSMEPLLYPSTANLAENTHGSPYFYLTLDTIIAKYLNVTFSYNYVKLTKKVIDFDGNFDWIYPEQSVVDQSIMIEISALLPVGGGMSFQAGYGYQHSFFGRDSAPVLEERKHYLILSTKKISF